jgi:hypothetical protein
MRMNMKTKISLIAVIIAGVGYVLLLKYPSPAKRSDPHQALQHDVAEFGPQAAAAAESRPLSDAPGDASEAEFQKQTEQRYINLKVWGLDFRIYASKHNDRFPETWEQAFSVSQMRANMDPVAFASFMKQFTNEFAIVYRGETEGAFDPGKTILFREKQPRRSPKGEWVKVYGFVDGTARIHTEPDEASFEAWENDPVKAR